MKTKKSSTLKRAMDNARDEIAARPDWMKPTPLDAARKGQFSDEFVRKMEQRVLVGFYKYGPAKEHAPKADYPKCIKQRVDLYLADGNIEWLIDAANFCLAPESRVWMADLSWRPIGELRVGDKIVGFTEEAETRRTQRGWKLSEVLSVNHIELPRYRVTFDNGDTLITSGDHQWLAVSRQGNHGNTYNYRWLRTAGDNRTGLRQHGNHFIAQLVSVIQPRDTYEAGWMAGVLDGEGHANQSTGRKGALRVMVGQNEGIVLSNIKDILTRWGYTFHETTTRPCHVIGLTGGIAESWRLLMETRPKRLISKLNPDKWGAVRQQAIRRVISVEEIGLGPVVAMGTSTRTFVAEGYGHHNCMLEYMYPQHPDAHFRSTSAAESPGCAHRDGEQWHGFAGKDEE